MNNDVVTYDNFGGAKFLWGNMPAIDVLALKHNEGLAYANALKLLFAGELIFPNSYIVRILTSVNTNKPLETSAMLLKLLLGYLLFTKNS